MAMILSSWRPRAPAYCDRRFTKPHEEGYGALEDNTTSDLQPNDVFIVEGPQNRYGNKNAWSAARR